MSNQIQFQNSESINRLQLDDLKKIVAYCGKKSPYYKRIIEETGFDWNDVNSFEDFRKLPFTSKEDLQQFNEDFLCVDRDKIADYSSTSGTLGEPIFIAMTSSDLERLAINESNTFENAGLSSKDTIQLMTTIDRRFMAGLAYYLGAQKMGTSVIRVGSGVPELQWDTILSLKPTAIVAVPSFIVKLIEYAQKNKIDYQNSSIQKAICIGEPIRNAELEMNALGQRITDAWNVELFSTYASTEMGAAFSECALGIGGHLQPDLLYIELIDEVGNPVKKGETGELTITTLGVEGMPLLRYKTGDVCRMYEEPCGCGRNTVRLGPIIGRKKQMIKYKGTTFYPPALFNLLNNFKEIENYLIELSTSNIGTDELTIQISSSNLSEDFLLEIREHFRAKLRVSPIIQFIDAEDLIRIQAPEKNRKPIKFIDYRTQS